MEEVHKKKIDIMRFTHIDVNFDVKYEGWVYYLTYLYDIFTGKLFDCKFLKWLFSNSVVIIPSTQPDNGLTVS